MGTLTRGGVTSEMDFQVSPPQKYEVRYTSGRTVYIEALLKDLRAVSGHGRLVDRVLEATRHDPPRRPRAG